MEDRLKEIINRINCKDKPYIATHLEVLEHYLYDIKDGLNICGCGTPWDTAKIIYKVLKIQSKRNDWDNKIADINKLFANDFTKEQERNIYGVYQFILYILDNKGFLEHGGGIGGAWLTQWGEDLLYVLEYCIENGYIDNL